MHVRMYVYFVCRSMYVCVWMYVYMYVYKYVCMDLYTMCVCMYEGRSSQTGTFEFIK